MYEVRQVIARLRLGESDRGIAQAQRIGRATVASIRRVAGERGWLDPARLLPEDGLLAAAFKNPRTTPQNVSSVEPFRESILAWHAQGIQVSTMHRALARQHAYAGSVHALHRFLARVGVSLPAATVILDFPVGETCLLYTSPSPRD